MICAMAVTFLFSRWMLIKVNELKSARILSRLGKQPEDIHFSFEELTYFISLPNRDPDIYNAELLRYVASTDFEGFVFPDVYGLMIELKSNDKSIQVAYLSLELLRAPVLERWKYEKKITDSEYRDLRVFVLCHSLSKRLIIEEVMKQIRRDDRILFIDESEA